ncbi:MAG: 5'/3'-nucleotidase SurE [Thermoanaerobaculaceae bacterium]|nr:5'/3'-nucleotidase SurE [Thermoanaerobaculaceae bacterium]MDI9620664.1 5'/3'-nucleotidase SurE [Acidobacteriota bacterium]NLH10273.1 5'/3'-nucleotidase SurE [Holophagae bacterium]
MRRLAVLVTLMLVAGWSLAQEKPRLHLMLVNDDGIDAPGLAALVRGLQDGYRLTVVAPAVEQSGVGHGITFRTPVLVEERPAVDGIRRFAVHAQPATCARIGVGNLLANDPPALVLSGINRGDNAGQSTWISGTLGGAREAALMALPAIAISAAHPRGGEPKWAAVGQWARLVVDDLVAAGLPRPGQVVKVEIPHPATAARGVRVNRMGLEPPVDQGYHEKAGPHGERLFVSSWTPPDHDAAGTDIDALIKGFVSVTPLSIDQSDLAALPALAAVPWSSVLPATKPAS